MSGAEPGQSPQLREQPVQRPCSWILARVAGAEREAGWEVGPERGTDRGGPTSRGFTGQARLWVYSERTGARVGFDPGVTWPGCVLTGSLWLLSGD